MGALEQTVTNRKEIEQLTATAAQSRRRYDLYKAASLTSKVTTPERLKELKAESEVAQMRLLRARASA
jgi:hypothetical protein